MSTDEIEDIYWSKQANEAEIRAEGKPLISAEIVFEALELNKNEWLFTPPTQKKENSMKKYN